MCQESQAHPGSIGFMMRSARTAIAAIAVVTALVTAGAVTGTALAAGPGGVWVANMDGSQIAPAPKATPATGFARVRLNYAETSIAVSMYFSGLETNVEAAHIHLPAPVGMNAPAVFTLAPTPGVKSGSVVNKTFDVTPVQVESLKAGLWYINLHTTGSPAGEIRGQLAFEDPFTAIMTGAQEAPTPNPASPATGYGDVSLNAAKTQALVSMAWTGLAANATGGHVHIGAPGVAGPIICNLNPTAAATSSVVDALCPFTPAQATALETGGLYINLHNAMFSAGEIRGQLQPRGAPPVPTILATDPASPAMATTPAVRGSGAEPDATVRIYAGECAGTPIGQGAGAAFNGAAGITVTVARGTTTQLRATATDPAGNVSVCSAPLPYEDQTPAVATYSPFAMPPTPPVTTPVSTPPSCRVPKVRKGSTLFATKAALKRARCKSGTISRTRSTVRKGRLVRLLPAAGSRTRKAVRVVLSAGPKPKRR